MNQCYYFNYHHRTCHFQIPTSYSSTELFTHSRGIRPHSPLESDEFWVLIRQACKVQTDLEYGSCGNRTSIGVDQTSSWFMLALYTNVVVCFFARGLLASSSTAQRFWTGFLFYTTHLTSAFLFLKAKGESVVCTL